MDKQDKEVTPDMLSVVEDLKCAVYDLKNSVNDIKTALEDSMCKKVNKCELNVVHPVLKQMINHGNWNDCLKVLQVEFQEEPTIGKELKYVLNEKNFLVAAAKFGCKNLLSLLLTNGLSANYSHESNTLLTLAVEYGHTDLVKLLLFFKADVNNRSHDGSPFTLASKYGYLEIIKILIDNGAANQYSNLFSLKTALQFDQLDAAIFLIENCDFMKPTCGSLYKSPLHFAVEKRLFEIINMILTKDIVHVDLGDECNETALHLAAKIGYIEAVELLIGYNANINVGNRFGWTPLHLAVSGSHVNVVKYLLQNANCDRNIQDRLGRTPLDKAKPEYKSEFEEIFKMK